MTNEFADAVVPTDQSYKTHDVVDHPHFFQAVIDQKALARQARNMTRQEMFNNGLITVEDMDDEELRCGRCRDASGHIPSVSKTMEMVPRDLYDEMVAEHAKRFDEKLRQQLDLALDTMVDVMTNPESEPKEQMEAAKWFVERVRGKTADKVIISPDKEPWQELLGDVAHITRQQHLALKNGVIDAEVVDLPMDSTETATSAPRSAVVGESPPPNGQDGSGALPQPDRGYAASRSDGEQVHSPMADRGDGVAMARDAVDVHAKPPSGTPMSERERNGRLGLGEQHWFDPATVNPGSAPAPMAPSHDNPATNSYALSQQIKAAQEEQQRVAAARMARRKIIDDAKKRRKVQRIVGVKTLVDNIDPDAFEKAQDRLLGDDTNTIDTGEREHS